MLTAAAYRRVLWMVPAILCAGALGRPAVDVVDDAGSARNGYTGQYSSIVVSDDQVAVAYWCPRDTIDGQPILDDLRFAWTTAGAWQWTTVNDPKDRLGYFPSMARAADGVYHIACSDLDSIRWFRGASTDWVDADTGLGSNGVLSICLRTDLKNRPHIAFFESSTLNRARLVYSFWTGAEWAQGPWSVVVDGLDAQRVVNINSFLAVDSFGSPHVVYPNAFGVMRHAVLSGASWLRDTIGEPAGYWPAIVLDAENQPRVTFDALNSLMYAERTGGVWSVEPIVDSDLTHALTLDRSGVVRVAFHRGGDVHLATRLAGAWTTRLIDDGGSADEPRLDLGGISVGTDPRGLAYISYAARWREPKGQGGRADLRVATAPSCSGDFNANGVTDSQDFFDFLGAFFVSDPSADFNADDVVNSQDFFDFLVAFFGGCP